MQKVAAAVTDRGAPPLVNHGAKRSAEIVEEAKAELSAEPDADDRWNPNPPSDLFTPEEQNEGEDRFRVIANLGRQQEVLGRALFDAGKVDPIVLNILAAAIEGIPATERTAGLKSNPGLRGTPFANAVIEAGGDAKRAPADFVVGYDAAVLGTTLY
jgi:hypothetical protein